MKRFFCTKCNRIKRVRSLPTIIENKELLDPSLRLGQCNSHFLVKPTRIIKSNKIESPIPILVNSRRRR